MGNLKQQEAVIFESEKIVNKKKKILIIIIYSAIERYGKESDC